MIERGDTASVAALHQDLAPTASRAAWRYKNASLAAIGVLWIVTAGIRIHRSHDSTPWLVASALAISLEQLAMPVISPRHWKSWTGVLVGAGLAAAIFLLEDVAVPIAPGAGLQHGLLIVTALAWATFAGALGVLSACLVPAWRALPLFEFRDQFVPFLRKADQLMPAVGRVAVSLSLATALASVLGTGALSAQMLALVVASLSVVGLSFVLNVPVNRRMLACGTALCEAELASMRARWIGGQLARTAVAAAIVIVLALETVGCAIA